MSEQNQPTESTIEQQLPVSAVLGLSDKGEADWARLRGLQSSQVAKLLFHRAYVHAILGLLVLQLFASAVGPVMVWSWFAALIAIQVLAIFNDRKHAAPAGTEATRSQLRKQSATTILSSTAWSVAVIFFAPYGTPDSSAALMALVVLLMAASVYFYTTAPVNMMISVLILGGSIGVAFGMNGHWYTVVAIALFTIPTLLGIVEMGRAHLATRLLYRSWL